VITETDAMIEHARQYYSENFREKETLSQNQDVIEFKKNLDEKLAELPSNRSCSASMICIGPFID
jgi:hypothetical protein